MAPGEDGSGLITIAARGREAGDNISELEAAVVSGPLTLALDAVLLDELLAAAGGLEVELGLQTPTLPYLIRPVAGADLRYLLMPCLPTTPEDAPAPPEAPEEAGDREPSAGEAAPLAAESGPQRRPTRPADQAWPAGNAPT